MVTPSKEKRPEQDRETKGFSMQHEKRASLELNLLSQSMVISEIASRHGKVNRLEIGTE